MRVDAEPGRREAGDVARTSGHLEHAPATAALEMMMVMRWANLVPRRLTGERDRDDVTVRHERLERTVNGGETQPGHRALRLREDLGR